MMKPILFNTEMVKAILEGRKTVTRRVIKTDKNFFCGYCIEGDRKHEGKVVFGDKSFEDNPCIAKHDYFSLPYKPGDILYVRETFGTHNGEYYLYRADYEESDNCYYYQGNICDFPKWKPSLHMPKEAARLFLKVTNVRVERLQDITIEQMISEGIKTNGMITTEGPIEYRICYTFEDLWNSTVKKQDIEKYGFTANPYVWVIEFERCEKPND